MGGGDGADWIWQQAQRSRVQIRLDLAEMQGGGGGGSDRTVSQVVSPACTPPVPRLILSGVTDMCRHRGVCRQHRGICGLLLCE